MTSETNPLVAAINAAPRQFGKEKQYDELPVLEDGLTAEELAAQANRSVEWVRTRLKALAAEGRLIIGKKNVQDLAGRKITVPCYKIKEEPNQAP